MQMYLTCGSVKCTLGKVVSVEVLRNLQKETEILSGRWGSQPSPHRIPSGKCNVPMSSQSKITQNPRNIITQDPLRFSNTYGKHRDQTLDKELRPSQEFLCSLHS